MIHLISLLRRQLPLKWKPGYHAFGGIERRLPDPDRGGEDAAGVAGAGDVDPCF